MTYALHTEFFFLFFIVIIAINANRKLLVFMYYGRAFHSLTLSLARSLLPLAQSSMGCTQLRGGGEKKIQKIAAPKMSLFPSCGLFNESIFSLFYDARNFFSLSFQVRPHFFFIIDGVWVSAFEFFSSSRALFYELCAHWSELLSMCLFLIGSLS